MSARLSTQYLDCLSSQGRLMVQTLVLSACNMIEAARKCALQGNGDLSGRFTVQVEQLMLQRKLAREILAKEFEQVECAYEAVHLQMALEELCRAAEVAVLEAQEAEARRADDEERAAAIAAVLDDLAALEKRGECGAANGIPWMVQPVKAA